MLGRMMNNFYYGKSGKGDFKQDDLPRTRWQLFWEMLRIRFSAISRLNLMTVAAWLPLIIVVAMSLMQIINAVVITGDYRAYQESGDAGSLTEEQIAIFAEADMNTLVTDVVNGTLSRLTLLLIPCLLITGPVKAGVAYVTRNWARDEHAFMWTDFKDAVKENWKQALGVSAISSVLPIVLYVGYQFYGNMAQDQPFFYLPQMLLIMLALVWALGCVFMYPMMVTYQVSFGKLVKNSLMLAIGRLPLTAGIRLVMLVPPAAAAVIFYLTASMIPLIVLGAYYLFLGYALTRFVFASYTNGVFDHYINSHMAGAQVNRGLAPEDDLDDEDEEENQGSGHLPEN